MAPINVMHYFVSALKNSLQHTDHEPRAFCMAWGCLCLLVKQDRFQKCLMLPYNEVGNPMLGGAFPCIMPRVGRISSGHACMHALIHF